MNRITGAHVVTTVSRIILQLLEGAGLSELVVILEPAWVLGHGRFIGGELVDGKYPLTDGTSTMTTSTDCASAMRAESLRDERTRAERRSAKGIKKRIEEMQCKIVKLCYVKIVTVKSCNCSLLRPASKF